MKNWLVNPTGKPNSWVPVDLMQEHNNLWTKVHTYSLARSSFPLSLTQSLRSGRLFIKHMVVTHRGAGSKLSPLVYHCSGTSRFKYRRDMGRASVQSTIRPSYQEISRQYRLQCAQTRFSGRRRGGSFASSRRTKHRTSRMRKSRTSSPPASSKCTGRLWSTTRCSCNCRDDVDGHRLVPSFHL